MDAAVSKNANAEETDGAGNPGRNVNEENEGKSKSSHSDSDEKVNVVTNQPGVGMDLSRSPEIVSCAWCGFSGETTIKYRRGPKAICCCCCGNYWTYYIGWVCYIGVPKCTRVNWWDVEHHCSNCTRKIGYNVPKVGSELSILLNTTLSGDRFQRNSPHEVLTVLSGSTRNRYLCSGS